MLGINNWEVLKITILFGSKFLITPLDVSAKHPTSSRTIKNFLHFFYEQKIF